MVTAKVCLRLTATFVRTKIAIRARKHQSPLSRSGFVLCVKRKNKNGEKNLDTLAARVSFIIEKHGMSSVSQAAKVLSASSPVRQPLKGADNW